MRLDLILRASSILTLESDRPTASQLGVLDGRIVGFDEQIEGLEAERIEEFPSGVITPGLIDAHCHTVWWGLGLSAVDLSNARGIEQVYELLASEVSRLDALGDATAWVHATGFNQAHHEGVYPDIARLDEITQNRPLSLRHTSGHATITNTTTLRMLGADDASFPNPVGGEIVRDTAGRPTGLINEAAQSLIQSLLLPYPTTDIIAALDAATIRFAAEGITSFTEAGVGQGWIGHSPIEALAYQQAATQGKLHARAQLMPALDSLRELNSHAKDFSGTGNGLGLDLGVTYGFGTEMVRFGHVKVFIDGSLLGATAAVSADFCGHENVGNRGYFLETPEHYRTQVMSAYRAGWPLALHAIGDNAIDFALDLIAEAHERYGAQAVPCRIEHFAIARPEQLERASRLGIAVTPQASFIGPTGDQIKERVGPERESWVYRGRSIIDAGVILAGSSDLPVADNNVRRAMQSAVDRRTDSGATLNSAEAITPEEALRSYTQYAARATGQLTDKGTLARGKFADFAVFSGSPLEAANIAEIDIVATFVGGVASYDSRPQRHPETSTTPASSDGRHSQ